MKLLSREQIAARLAQDIPNGSIVNLGIGMPTLVASYINPAHEVVLHSENGVLGMGPTPCDGDADPDLINAGKQPVSIVPGAAFFHHADSFAMMRGGHLDICVLGAFQVSIDGDLANWHTGEHDAIPAVGGAMDLANGAKSVYVMMNLLTRESNSKLVEKCSYPLTAASCVDRIYSDMGVFLLRDGIVYLLDDVAGLGIEKLRTLTGVNIIKASN